MTNTMLTRLINVYLWEVPEKWNSYDDQHIVELMKDEWELPKNIHVNLFSEDIFEEIIKELRRINHPQVDHIIKAGKKSDDRSHLWLYSCLQGISRDENYIETSIFE